ncbi:hypothetical protein O9993_05825 [Vibrio lentus]|nr:hypothetical protein [Vibrio lentus]
MECGAWCWYRCKVMQNNADQGMVALGEVNMTRGCDGATPQ